MSSAATAVFVHGGWHDGWSWHLVRELLDARGVPSVALDLPMTTLDSDAAVLSDALAAIEGDAIVVSHSWGGSVATLGAIGAPNVRHLIYLAAAVTEAGHPTLSPPASVPVKGRETLRPKVIIETDTTTIIDRDVSLEAFYHDVEPSLARQAASRLRPFQKKTESVEQNARTKLMKKNLDMIAANEVGDDKAFDVDDNQLIVLARGARYELGRAGKAALARGLVSLIARELSARADRSQRGTALA